MLSDLTKLRRRSTFAILRSGMAPILVASLLLAAMPEKLPAQWYPKDDLPGMSAKAAAILAASLGASLAAVLLFLRGKKGPKVDLDTSHLQFNYVRPGTSAEKSVAVTNPMQTPITLTEISIQGAADGFSIPQGRQVPFLLAPGERVGLRVRFSALSSSIHSSRLRIVAVSSVDPKRRTKREVKLTASN